MFEKWAVCCRHLHSETHLVKSSTFTVASKWWERGKPDGPLVFDSWAHVSPTSGFTCVLYLYLCDIVSLLLAKDPYLFMLTPHCAVLFPRSTESMQSGAALPVPTSVTLIFAKPLYALFSLSPQEMKVALTSWAY